MTKLNRVTAKIFGETASASGNDPEIGQFGSAKAGTYNGTTDVATIQGLSAWSNGWIDAVTPTQQFPPLPEMTGVHKVLSYQEAYLLQQGIPEWDAGTTYYENNFCAKDGKIYFSKTDSNINNDPAIDTVNWEEFTSGGASRNIGEIVPSTIPLTDAGLHLLDGTLISGSGSYAQFVTYIAGLVSTYPDLFTDEATYQSAVALTGICNKFVYDSVNNTVRIPKYGTQIFTKSSTINTASTVPVRGNGKTLGLTNGSQNFGLAQAANDYNFSTDGFDVNIGVSATANAITNGLAIGVTTDPTKSGLVANTTSVASLTNYPLDCYYYIVIATSTKTDVEVDIDEIATDLNGKADRDLLNLTTGGENRLHALKAYLDNGTLLTDGQGLADLKSMAHTTFDVSKFTVTGSPTITADGIASGFSSSNYITIPDLDVTGEDFEFDFGKITTPSTINNINTFIAGTTSGKRFIVAISNEGKFYVSSGGDNFSTIIRNTAVTTNTDYYLKAGITGSSVYLKVSTDGTNWDTTTGSVTTAYTALQAELVGGGSSIAPYAGQLNLKDFVVRIGGAPVFTGNQTGSQTYTIGGSSVTIPYTITKQGISIVDSYYRTQVTALGNQEGWTPFFTLSDTDYTLPIGCMYGQFVNRNTPHIVATYYNDTEWYVVYSNGWVEQGGVTKTANPTVVFLQAYNNERYNVVATQLGNGEYNANLQIHNMSGTGFSIYQNQGNWIFWRAIGYKS